MKKQEASPETKAKRIAKPGESGRSKAKRLRIADPQRNLQTPPVMVNLWFENYVRADRIIIALNYIDRPAAAKKLIAQARNDGKLIDASHGRPQKTAVLLDTEWVLILPLTTAGLVRRMLGLD